jgi:hypothetical protein
MHSTMDKLLTKVQSPRLGDDILELEDIILKKKIGNGQATFSQAG